MQTPICKICFSSDLLCSGCQTGFDNKEFTQFDVDLSRAMFKLSEKHPAILKSEFKKTITVKDMSVVIVPKGTAGQFIGKGGLFIKDISNDVGKRLKVVEETTNPKELVQKILFPAKLIGVNVVYGVDKKESYKVRVSRLDRYKLHDPAVLENLFKDLLKGETSIIFE